MTSLTAILTGPEASTTGHPERVDGDRDRLPLAFNQSGYLVLEWLAQLRGRRSVSAPVSLGLTLEGAIDIARLEGALNAVIERHEVLRTAFPDPCTLTAGQERALLERLSRNDWSATGVFTQSVRPKTALTIAVEDLPTGIGEDSEADWLRDRVRDSAQRPFEYQRPPLMRATLYQLSATRSMLVVLLNHLVADGWSMSLLRREIEHHYDAGVTGRAVDLPDLPIQFGDFAHWQRRRFSQALPADEVAHWATHWSLYGENLVRPAELRSAAAPRTSRGRGSGCETIVLPREAVQGIVSAGRRHRLTTYMMCTAAAAALFHARTLRRRLAWWAYCANRASSETEHLIGWFAQGRVIGIDVDPNEPVRQLLASTQQAVCDASDKDEVPIQVLWQHLGGREIPYGEAFGAGFVSFDLTANRPPSAVTLADGVVVRPAARDLLSTWNRPSLGLWALDAGSDLLLGLRYAVEEFTPESIRSLVNHWGSILTEIGRHPDESLGQLIARL